MITEDYVSFETAKLLKEKGFDWCESPFYSEQDRDEWWQNNSYTVPNEEYDPDLPFDSETLTLVAPHVSIQMAMKWLIEVHKLFIFISTWLMHENSVQYYFEVREIKTSDFETLYDYTSEELNSPEKAAEAAIKYCLEKLV